MSEIESGSEPESTDGGMLRLVGASINTRRRVGRR